MDEHDITEQAFKNGYEKGKQDAVKWIPVTERLPDVDDDYLACNERGWRGVLSFAKDARKINKYDFHKDWVNVWYGYDSEWGYYTIDSVTHWMPLPQPPKGD